MSRVSVPPVTVVHYVDPVCPWSLGLERPLRQLKEVYRDRLLVEYRTAVAVPEIKMWMKRYGFDYESLKRFHDRIAKQTGVHFDRDFAMKTGLESSLPVCLAFEAARLQGEEEAARYLSGVMDAFLVRAKPINEEALIEIARGAGLDERRLVKDMRSKKVRETVKSNTKTMGREGVTFLDLIVRTPDGRTEKVAEAFSVDSIEKVIDELVPGLPKYTRTVSGRA